jgi:hypothetical protein
MNAIKKYLGRTPKPDDIISPLTQAFGNINDSIVGAISKDFERLLK